MATTATTTMLPHAGTADGKHTAGGLPSVPPDTSAADDREDAPSLPRGDGPEERDPSPHPSRVGTGAGVKKKLKAKAAAAAAASFDGDERDPPSATAASAGAAPGPIHPAPSSGMFGSINAAAVMMQAEMNLNDASFDLLHNDLLPQDSFGFNLTAVQSLSFDMAEGEGGDGGGRGRESAGWAIGTAGQTREGGAEVAGAGPSYADCAYQGGLPVTVSSSVEQSTPKRMEHQVSLSPRGYFVSPSTPVRPSDLRRCAGK